MAIVFTADLSCQTVAKATFRSNFTTTLVADTDPLTPEPNAAGYPWSGPWTFSPFVLAAASAQVSELNAGAACSVSLGYSGNFNSIAWTIDVTGFPPVNGTHTGGINLTQALPGVPGATVALIGSSQGGSSFVSVNVTAPCGTVAPPFIVSLGASSRADLPAIPPLPTGTMIGSCSLWGTSQDHPQLPVAGTNGFCGGASGNWFDPPLALGYDFQQIGGSLFTDILTLPVGIDGDGLFEVQVGNQSLGQFAEGSGVNFVQLLGNGVPAFRIVGIDPGADATDVQAFPVQLAFNTPTADFTMTPVTWRALGSSCSDPVCPQCPATTLAPIGDALDGNLSFALGIQNGPTNGAAGFFLGIGTASLAPLPLWCGSVFLPPQNGIFHVGSTALTGSASCDGTGSVPLPLVPTPSLFGVFLTIQAVTLCPQNGLGLTPAIEFPIGS